MINFVNFVSFPILEGQNILDHFHQLYQKQNNLLITGQRKLFYKDKMSMLITLKIKDFQIYYIQLVKLEI